MDDTTAVRDHNTAEKPNSLFAVLKITLIIGIGIGIHIMALVKYLWWRSKS